MLGVALTILACLGLMGLGRWIVRPLAPGLDPAAQIGLAGLVGLGCLGWVTLPMALLPRGIGFGVWVVGILAGLGSVHLASVARTELRFSRPQGIEWLAFMAMGLALLFALVGVLAPSDALDWDSLSYHLAVPKLWLEAGHIVPIPFIHHSNFPFVVDNLYVWGLSWGGQQGAKAFSLAFFTFGLVSLFGLTRQSYGRTAALWASAAFAGVPVVVWESGTAYIDVAHGLFAGLGAILVFRGATTSDERRLAFLGAILLGLAVGSKYTGLQAVAAVAVCLALALALAKKPVAGLKTAGIVAAIALAIGSPWYIKNALWTGNPVYPFFYEKLGGRNWDARRAEIYRHEQETFGVGRTNGKLDPTTAAHAILGLAYQPGRYVNPGQAAGLGFPQGALGAAVLCGALALLLSGRARRPEALLLAYVGVSLLMWWVLSQQSRYVVGLLPPLCLLLGAGVVRLRAGPLLAGVAALQILYSLFLVHSQVTADQLPVVLGKVSPDEYLSRRVPFYRPSRDLNELAKGGKVALYDETFVFLLDVPSFWANPGHSTIIPYDGLTDGAAYAAEMRQEGFTHIYVNLAMQDPDSRERWLQAAGIALPATPFSPEERRALLGDWQQKWRLLLAEAIASGDLRVVRRYRGPSPRALVLETQVPKGNSPQSPL